MNRFIYATLLFASPAMVFAQEATIGSRITALLNFIAQVVSFLGPVLIGVAILAFFASLIVYLFKRDEAPNSGKYLAFSVLILFIMVSIWGIIAFLQSNLGIQSESAEGATENNIRRIVPTPVRLQQ